MIASLSKIDANATSPICRQVRLVAARIVAGLDSDTAEAVYETLDPVLRRLERTAWPSVLGRFSSLCLDHCPVEFTFSSADDAVRCAMEVAGPELAEHLRLDTACACLEELGLATPPPSARASWRRLQAGNSLRWGAWLGVRVEGNRRAAKLYIEVPRGQEQWGPPPLTPCCRLHMIGFDCASGMSEHYFRTTGLGDLEHRALLDSFRRHAKWPELLEAFSALRGMPGEAALRWTRFGYSLRQGPTALKPGGLTLFADSEACGGSSGVRRALLSALSGEQLRRSVYADLLAHVPEGRLPEHGIVSLSAAASGRVELRAGVSARSLAATLA